MSSAGTTACPRCGAPRVQAADCPRCGVIYAKAEAHALAAAAIAPSLDVAAPQSPETTWSEDANDEALELRLRICAIPLALFIASLAVWSDFGHFFVCAFASMWV